MKLHEDEFDIDAELVRGLLEGQMPDLAGLSLRRFDSAGTVNAVYRLGVDLLVRLPRAPEYVAGPEREAQWMPVFARSLPIHVPKYERLGHPTSRYPSHWSVLEWVEGDPASEATLTNLEQAAADLGEFVQALRNVSTANAPTGGNYRAFGLADVDGDFRDWLAKLPEDIDRSLVESIWKKCISVDDWEMRPCWVHTDLRGDNLITREGTSSPSSTGKAAQSVTQVPTSSPHGGYSTRPAERPSGLHQVQARTPGSGRWAGPSS